MPQAGIIQEHSFCTAADEHPGSQSLYSPAGVTQQFPALCSKSSRRNFGYILTRGCVSDIKGEVKNCSEENSMELPLPTLIHKALSIVLPNFSFRERSPLTEYSFSSFFFEMERASLDFKGRCGKGEPGLIFLPLLLWGC